MGTKEGGKGGGVCVGGGRESLTGGGEGCPLISRMGSNGEDGREFNH